MDVRTRQLPCITICWDIHIVGKGFYFDSADTARNKEEPTSGAPLASTNQR